MAKRGAAPPQETEMRLRSPPAHHDSRSVLEQARELLKGMTGAQRAFFTISKRGENQCPVPFRI